jgi:hypothetical protein
MNKLCNVASCWIYIGILLGAHPILHISRIRVNISAGFKLASLSKLYSLPCTVIMCVCVCVFLEILCQCHGSSGYSCIRYANFSSNKRIYLISTPILQERILGLCFRASSNNNIELNTN